MNPVGFESRALRRSSEVVTPDDIGFSYKQVHEARQIRDAEAADPGIIRRKEIAALGLAALRAAPDGLDTRELTVPIMRAKGLDVDEAVFRKSLTQSVMTLFGRLERKGVVRCVRRRRGVKVWVK